MNPMIRILALTAAFALLPLSAAFAQVTVQTDTPVAGDAAMAAMGELQAAGAELEPVFDMLEAQAAGIRADAGLSAEQKEARILAMVAPHQPAIDRLGNAVAAFVEIQARNEGVSAEEAAAAAAGMRARLVQGVVQGLVMGEADHGGD